MTSATLGGAGAREADDDVDTRVYVRPTKMPWDRMMVLQIMRDLTPEDGRKRATPTPAPSPAAIIRGGKAARPNVFLTRLPSDPPAPWATARKSAAREGSVAARNKPVLGVRRTDASVRAAHASPRTNASVVVRPEEDTLVRPRWRHQAPRSTLVPTALFILYFLIAFGLGQDRELRNQTVSDVRGAASASVDLAHSSAIRLWRLVSRILT
jgi:hypothetical protein